MLLLQAVPQPAGTKLARTASGRDRQEWPRPWAVLGMSRLDVFGSFLLLFSPFGPLHSFCAGLAAAARSFRGSFPHLFPAYSPGLVTAGDSAGCSGHGGSDFPENGMLAADAMDWLR